MDKYVKLSQKSLSALAAKLSERLLPDNNRLLPHYSLRPPQRSKGMEGMLRDLISIPSISNDYEQLHIALDYVDQFLSERGLRVKRFEWNGVESMVATTQRTKTPKVMLMAHLDVVPGEGQYELREKDGKYFGRGTFDMKFAVAAYLQLIDELQANLQAYDLGLMFVTDEEVGGFDGAEKLVEEGYLPKVIVIPDGGDNWDLETSCKGFWWVTLQAIGKTAHSSRPWEGDSAMHRLVDALHDIRKLFPQQTPEHSTINIGILNGGDVPNKLAAEATARIDFRTASLQDEKRVKAAVERICKQHRIELTTTIYSPPITNNPQNHYLQSFMASIKKVTGYTPGETKSHAGSDARFFAAAGVPCVIVRPEGGNLHGPGEWISKKGFFELKDVLLDYIEREARINN